jgi:hypothetical protein
MTMVAVAGCLVLGLVAIMIGPGLIGDLFGGIADAFSNSMTRLTSQAPASAPPSGVALTTPLLDAPSNGGYTNQLSVPISGSVPSATVGKTGYSVRVYMLGANGAQRQVASVPVGGTTRFVTSPIRLSEGNNTFIAKLRSSAGEGGPSPLVTYVLDTTPPKIDITSPASGAKLSTSKVDVSGSCDAGATVVIRNEQAPAGGLNSQVVGADGGFKLTVPLVAGSNTIYLAATDQAGNSASTSVTVSRNYGQLSAHLSVSPSKFKSSSQPTLKLALHATSFNGGPLANAKVTFTVSIQGLSTVVSPELTTDSTGVATWSVPIGSSLPGSGQASVLVTSPAGDTITSTTAITTT